MFSKLFFYEKRLASSTYTKKLSQDPKLHCKLRRSGLPKQFLCNNSDYEYKLNKGKTTNDRIVYKLRENALDEDETQLPEIEWISLNFQQLLTLGQTKFSIIKSNNRKIGNNILTNRLHILNNKVLLSDLNDSVTSK